MRIPHEEGLEAEAAQAMSAYDEAVALAAQSTATRNPALANSACTLFGATCRRQERLLAQSLLSEETRGELQAQVRDMGHGGRYSPTQIHARIA